MAAYQSHLLKSKLLFGNNKVIAFITHFKLEKNKGKASTDILTKTCGSKYFHTLGRIGTIH
jgi:hypothetical protein